MFEHYKLDNPEKKPAYTDEDYDEEEANVDGYSAKEAKEEGRLPIRDHERYDDPDFEAEWNAEDEVSDTDILPEKPSENGSEMFGEQPEGDIKNDTDPNEEDEWEVL